MGNFLEQNYFGMRPKTYKALKSAVMAAADANASLGKRGLFGGDKHRPAFERFKLKIEELCSAIDIDGDMVPVKVDNSWETLKSDGNYLNFINTLILKFKEIYPNWQDAYRYWEEFYTRANAQGIKRY